MVARMSQVGVAIGSVSRINWLRRQAPHRMAAAAAIGNHHEHPPGIGVAAGQPQPVAGPVHRFPVDRFAEMFGLYRPASRNPPIS